MLLLHFADRKVVDLGMVILQDRPHPEGYTGERGGSRRLLI
jgi:hypothetical protein